MQDPRPLAFRCSSELRDEIERRAEASGRRPSEVIRQLLDRAIVESSIDAGEGDRLARLEASVEDLQLQLSELARAVGMLAEQQRFGVEAILKNLDPDAGRTVDQWLDRRFPPVLGEARGA